MMRRLLPLSTRISWQRRAANSVLRRHLRAAAPAPHGDKNSEVEMFDAISLILRGSSDAETSGSSVSTSSSQLDTSNNILDVLCFPDSSPNAAMQWRKDVLRERKKKYIFKNTESRRFTNLIKECSNKLGTDSTLEFFVKLGRDTGVKEFNTLIRLCMDRAKSSRSEDSTLQIQKIYALFQTMRERGLPVEEETYGPFLKFLVDMYMVEEFQKFKGILKDGNPQACLRIGYYEMLLWIRVGDEDKIRELCEIVSGKDSYDLAECYMLAFCESDREKELVMLLNVLDISKVSETKFVSAIFKSLGRLGLVKFAEKFLLDLSVGSADDDISSFICDYTISIPNLAVEKTMEVFLALHQEFKVTPSVVSYDKLITLCCSMFKVETALQIVDHMCQSRNDVPIESFNPILLACEHNYEFNLVNAIYGVMQRHNLKPKEDTFRSMIVMCVKMKDYQAAYNMLRDVQEIGDIPTVSLYNAILAGYFREKNRSGALMVLKHMKRNGIEPDSETFNYLISNSVSEQEIAKFYNEMHQSGVQVTKYIYMALVHAYAKCSNIEMSKKVLQDPDMPLKHLIEVKSSLVAALALNGALSDALDIYGEIKKDGFSLEPKSALILIENVQCPGKFDSLRLLLEELRDTACWVDGCNKVIVYCVQHNHANAAIDLLRQLKDKDQRSAHRVIDQIYYLIWSMRTTNLEFGMKLLHAVKEELGLVLSRTSLDFLLSTCAKAKDSSSAWKIWKEYESSSLPYNALSYLRMYQTLLASGARKSARVLLKRIPKDDVHVDYVIRACKQAYRFMDVSISKGNR